MAATVTAPVAEAATMPRYRFSVEEFELMHKGGIFNEDSPVELIRGEIVRTVDQTPAHVSCVADVSRTAASLFSGPFAVFVRCTIRLPGPNMPNPDLTIARESYDRRFYPAPPDILAIGEVADLSLAYDRLEKLPLFAEAGIPEAWIFNLVDRQVERYTEPRDGSYHQIMIATRGERLTSTLLPALTFDVNEALGLDMT